MFLSHIEHKKLPKTQSEFHNFICDMQIRGFTFDDICLFLKEMNIEEDKLPKDEKENNLKERCDKEREIKSKITETYYDIVDYIGEWCDIPENYKKIIAIWIIGTYIYKQFDTYPYLFLNATRGAGKTRLLRIISWLQKNGNGEILTNPSDAVLFRTAQERGIILDEFETEKSKEKQIMREYLNSCYKKGGLVYRMEKQKDKDGKEKQVAVGYPLYTPVAMANINGLDDVLGDRCITLILEKSMNMYYVKKIEDYTHSTLIKNIKTNLSLVECIVCSVYPLKKGIEKWNDFIRNKYSTELHTIHTIHNYTETIHQNLTLKEIEYDEIYKKIDETGIFGRNLELFFPLLITAYSFNKEVFEDIIKIVTELNNLKKEDEFAESKDIPLIEFVSLAERYRFEYVYTHELFNEFKNFFGNQGNDEESKWLNITWFGLTLKRLKLIEDRKRVAKGKLILLRVDRAKEKLKIFKTEEEIKK